MNLLIFNSSQKKIIEKNNLKKMAGEHKSNMFSRHNLFIHYFSFVLFWAGEPKKKVFSGQNVFVYSF